MMGVLTTPNNIHYRILNDTDINSYKKIRLDCLKNHPQNFGTLYEEEIHSQSFKFEKVLSADTENDFLFGAFENQQLIGICGFIQEKRLKTKHIGEISQMYVLPLHGKKGIAKQLLHLTIERAFLNKHLEQITLGVVNSNNRALSLYEKTGFLQYGFIENYYKYNNNYEAMVLMALTRNSFK
jgi:ribosomal protein S18 acetylase RimI-like enzyme